MDIKELKKQFPDIDFDKLESIIARTSSMDGLCSSMKETFPDFNEAEFRKAFENLSNENGFNVKDIEAAQDLSDTDLEEIAGGSVGSWFSKNKEWLVPVLAIGISAAAAPLLYKASKSIAAKADYKKGFAAGEAEAIEETNKLNFTFNNRNK